MKRRWLAIRFCIRATVVFIATTSGRTSLCTSAGSTSDRSQALEHLQPVHFWQRQIEDDERVVLGVGGGVLLDSGAALFKRQAFVDLDGSFGRVVIGRSSTTTYDFVILFDPLGYAPNCSWARSANATGPSKYGMIHVTRMVAVLLLIWPLFRLWSRQAAP